MQIYKIPFLSLLLAFKCQASSYHVANPGLKYIMYLTGQHNVVPEPSLVSSVTHIALAFMRSEIFNDPDRTTWPLFADVEEVRLKFAAGTKVQVAIGGWGNTEGFEIAAKTDTSRKIFATNVKAMVDATGADGVDIDWEYPGGNGEDYKKHLNSGKAWQISAYPELLAAIRAALGDSKIISAAVPGLPRDMLAFTPSTLPDIMKSADFLNVMTYDLMNRRDNVTKHHTGVAASLSALNAYIQGGVQADRINLGLAFYIKWFKTAEDAHCNDTPLGCKTELMEDPTTGSDLGKAGAFSWHDEVPAELAKSFDQAMRHGTYDQSGGGHYYWDREARLFWSWDTPDAIGTKIAALLGKRKLGGAFAWGLGEDATRFEHLEATNAAMEILRKTREDEAYRERSEL